ncbi:FMN-binding protein [Clostridium disporicum]|uniref:RnfABCDGE type electron transport complex subunit G n=1 Tax=Clostridium disporicum TaxID=84024 RepID=A0A173ZAL1_9CLOT|nr:FMN-binding protein [Clostridium disporicum]CUN72977.1 RnfABCDGE type electron transport complex subunit G [Clostridium disporicum]
MSKQSSILRPTLVLGLITLVVSAVLVLTYNLTGVGVAGPAISDEMLAMAVDVLPGGEGFDDAGVGSSATVPAVIGTSNDAGYVINAIGKGYGGDMSVLVGLDNDGKITGVKVYEMSETPGIGTKVTEDADFLATFIGKTSVDGSDAVSGATFSSKGLNEAITNAFDAFNIIKSGGQLEGGSAPAGDSNEKAEEKPAEPAVEYKAAKDVTIDDVKEAAKEVLVDGDNFEEVSVEADNVNFVLKAENGAGYVINSVGVGFYDDDISVVIGFDADKNITGVKVVGISDTPGIGTQVAEAEFLNQFVGKSEIAEDIVVSGATFSSTGLNEAVRAAIEAVKGVDA